MAAISSKRWSEPMRGIAASIAIEKPGRFALGYENQLRNSTSMTIPDLRLTPNQVVPAIWWTRYHMPFDEGPTREFMAHLNYLRGRGVPFPPEAVAPGSGR